MMPLTCLTWQMLKASLMEMLQIYWMLDVVSIGCETPIQCSACSVCSVLRHKGGGFMIWNFWGPGGGLTWGGGGL